MSLGCNFFVALAVAVAVAAAAAVVLFRLCLHGMARGRDVRGRLSKLS